MFLKIFVPHTIEQFFSQLVRNIMVTDYFFVYSYFFQWIKKIIKNFWNMEIIGNIRKMTFSVLAKWEAEEEQEEGRNTTPWTEPTVAIPLLEPTVITPQLDPDVAIPLSESAMQDGEDLSQVMVTWVVKLSSGGTLRFFIKFVSWVGSSNLYRPNPWPKKHKM